MVVKINFLNFELIAYLFIDIVENIGEILNNLLHTRISENEKQWCHTLQIIVYVDKYKMIVSMINI